MPEILPLSPERIVFDLRTCSDAAVAPDGSGVAFVVSAARRGARRPSAQIWHWAPGESDPRPLTHAPGRQLLPRWRPDGGELAFVSDRDGTWTLFLLPREGGEARPLLRYPEPFVDVAWSPDGRRLAFAAGWDPEPRSAPDAPPSPRVTRRIDYKQDNRGYLGEKRIHLFVADAESGEFERISTMSQDHGPPRWSPDGAWLATQVANRNGMCSQLAVLRPDGGELRLFGPEDGNVGTWAWAPDGTRIIFTGDTQRTWQSDFFLLDLRRSRVERLTDDLPVLPAAGFPTIELPSMPVWLDDDTVLFHAVRAGSSGLYRFRLSNRRLACELDHRAVCAGLSSSADGRYAVQSATSFEYVGEVVLVDRQRGTVERTHFNDALLAESPPARWERFSVHRGGLEIDAWLLFPPDFDPSKRYPLVLDVHGGPNGYYGYAFNPVQQVLATHGFLVLFANPRGSSSYGREFTMRVLADWGGEDYLDLMAVLDAALERPYVDPDRVGIWGYSYGGYMTAWAIAQSGRFAAAVCGAPCFDLVSMYGTSDIAHHFGELQWGGTPWERFEWYRARSPSTYAHRVRTPTLIIHGEADERCPIGQGEEMFVALKKAGCEVEFVRYPEGSHLFLRAGYPDHRADALRRILSWFRLHLGAPSGG